ncbi:MFS transporter [Actinomadura kijaniata]|uniref:EmrB/QacA subfamily drug resistance transporter n=1 Tax=Actinomadura namibiensis TaxID=182080 RepID=A0A7W3LNR0_ACTNM|nr:MFS transporter [Actinomadura namibiensis]MBA8951513.1 EmrB/QacA subfamily drug resistance transporter [Actinomadura namibiensis]
MRPGRRWPALAAALLATFMDLVDVTIVNVALPSIQRDLGADAAAGQWAASVYALGYGLFLITGGRLGDVWGRRRVLLAGIVGFVAASVAAGAAGSAEALVAARAAQGACAGLMVPQALSVITVQFPPGRQRTLAFTLYGLVLGVAQVGGPVLGGLLTQYGWAGLGWRTIFYVNVPVGLVALLGAWRWMDDSRARPAPRLDPAGMLLAGAATLLVTFPLVEGRERGWPLWSLAMLAGAPVVAGVFWRHQRGRERRGASPLVPPELLRRRSFGAGLVLTLALFAGVSACFIALTWGLQFALGWSPMRVALAGLAWPAGVACTAQLTHRYGHLRARLLVRTGSAVMAAGMTAVAATTALEGRGLTPWALAPGLAVCGIGMGLVLPVLANAVISEVPAGGSGAASGVFNSVTQLAGVLGVAAAGVLFFGRGADPGAADPAGTARALAFAAVAFAVAAALAGLLPRRLPYGEAREGTGVSPVPV